MADLKVVPISDEPSLVDIPGQLRALADRIEAGEYGDLISLFAIMPRDQQYPLTFAWGVDSGAYDPIIQFELARHWHVHAAAGLPVDVG